MIGGEGVVEIAKALSNCSCKLRIVDLQRCSIYSEGIYKFCNLLYNANRPLEIDLSYNFIQNDCSKSIQFLLKSNRNIIKLNIEKNFIDQHQMALIKENEKIN